MPVQHLKPVLSPEEYLEGERTAEFRHEYVSGEVYAMAGVDERHNRIAGNIAFQLRAKARGGSCGVFMSDMKLRINQGVCFYYPDVMLTCDSDDRDSHFKDNPCLIAEVSSPSTEAIDHREKLLAYKNIPSLRYYLLIASNRQYVEYYQRNQAGEWQSAILEPHQVIHVQCEGGDTPYEAGLCLEDIYEDVAW
ncbi:MAG: Uma2 family endonuclease [uncultured Thiotrichaceae bacterium]|uniref:Uma2 family endonuclease n=1 Tax=uncultured Thiotrichaceae bacterium TaxID=298394 RepID=A0A6S6TXB6_9GAMM|nr:MAG: Uma2 family endonuclease [uncultured Thiotrichaceae bacterium]